MTRLLPALSTYFLVIAINVHYLNGQDQFRGSVIHTQFPPLQTPLAPLQQQQQHEQNGQAGIPLQNWQPLSQSQPQPQQKPFNLQPQNRNATQQQQPISDRICDLIAAKTLKFALDTGIDLSANQYYSKSQVFSPFSLVSAVALLLLGAKGETYKQLSSLFGIDTDYELQANPGIFHREFGKIIEDLEQEDASLVLNHRKNVPWQSMSNTRNIRVRQEPKPIKHICKIANGIFEQSGFSLNPYYKDVVTSIYNSELVQLDFYNDAVSATDYINKWVSNKTYGRIPTILSSPLVKDTKLILASALYFKAFWENTFFAEATSEDKFFPDGEYGPAIKVKMMATGGIFPFYDAIEHNCRIIGLPYRGNLTTMYIIQPYQSSRQNLRAFQASLNSDKIEDMISKMTKKTAVLALPKMHVTHTINMKNIMQRMGITAIFANGQSDVSLIENLGSIDNSLSTAFLSNSQKVAKPLLSRDELASKYNIRDRFSDAPLIFASRFGGANLTNTTANENKTAPDGATVAVAAGNNMTMTNMNPNAEHHDELMKTNKTEEATKPRNKRQIQPQILHPSLEALEYQRRLVQTNRRSDLFVEDILHKVDFDVNEHGTEAAAATLTYLKRSGTDILFRTDTPFLVLIRHDPTKMVLFYGIINEPES